MVKTIQCKAAIMRSPGEELSIEDIRVDPPKAGEVRVKILYSSICHTDVAMWKSPAILENFTFSPPIILGHEGAGIVESVGEGVTEIQPGDHVICNFQGECGKCKLCKEAKTNFCELCINNLGSNVMPADKKTRFYSMDGTSLHHFVNCSTFTEYTVVLEAAVSKIEPELPLDKACLLSCGVPTGLGSALNIGNIQPGSTVAVIGLGTVGLAVVEGARLAGASRIIAIDMQPSKFPVAKEFGATDCINPQDYEVSIDKVVHEMTNGGVDYSFECVGKSQLILNAIECLTIYGTCVIVGLCKVEDKITFTTNILLTGRQIKSGYYGGYKGKTHMPKLIQKCSNQEVNLDRYITHRLPFSKIKEGFELVMSGSCIKCVLHMDDNVPV